MCLCEWLCIVSCSRDDKQADVKTTDLSPVAWEDESMEAQRPKQVNILFHILGILLLKILRWEVEGEVPKVSKYVLIIAPHTSYWDYPVALFISWKLRIRGVWFGKSEMFEWPLLGKFFPKTGGIPVYRNRSQGLVGQIIQTFKERDHILFALTPEGTRTKVEYWKSGFYQIALETQSPICLAYLDYKRKAGGFGALYYPTGDVEKDLEYIRAFYATVTPRHPDRVGPVKFRDDNLK